MFTTDVIQIKGLKTYLNDLVIIGEGVKHAIADKLQKIETYNFHYLKDYEMLYAMDTNKALQNHVDNI